ncbi:hypothetical protein CU097_003569 [Rhizopus azygosporus]|uniref:Uncharacterized protein n=1 Tax=Rhizopus azygosporus TaxID=86630 RepID=A0A367JYV7_RHIAZ|nr:hypothetical protein CU097_003569 [Rhizopus azygosporus]
MQMMIVDYFEVNHIDVGMQLIESMFSTGKRPPSALLLTLINLMLQSKDSFRSKETQVTHWIHCKQAHMLLMDILTLFGPNIYKPVWNEFMYFNISCSQQSIEEEDESSHYELLNTKELSHYFDFWDYTDKLLNHSSLTLNDRCRTLVLDFLINVLQADLKEKLNDEKKVGKSIMFGTLSTDSMLSCTKFDKYLDILLKNYPNKNDNLTQLVGSLLNMLITISCFERISSFDSLVSQMYSRFQKMDPDTSLQFMQSIKYPSFLIALLDKALSDTDISLVDNAHKKFRNKKHVPLRLEKVLFYVLKTQPITCDSIDALYKHVLIVSKYCMCVFSTASICHKKRSGEKNTALSEEQLILLIEQQHTSLDKWETLIEELLAKFPTADLNLIEKIRWAIKLTRLTITEYV